MFNYSTHNVNRFLAHLILLGSLFCVLFGQGVHIHSISLHVEDYFDIHAHVHAHESYDEPMQDDHSEEEDNHQHEVSTASDIIGTLTSPYQLRPDIQSYVVHGVDTEYNSITPGLEQSPTLFGLPPPRPLVHQYHLSSFSRRGPPIA